MRRRDDDGGVRVRFWSTVVAKTINGEAQIHARVDGKKVITSKSSFRRDLQLADEEGVACLPNSTIFEQLALMGLQTRVLDLEKTNTTQANEIDSLKRVKKIEKKQRLRTHKLKRLYMVGLTIRVESLDNEESLGEDASKQRTRRIDDIDADEGITLVSTQDDAEMFDAEKDLGGEEVFVKQEVVDKENIDEVTLAQALLKLKTSKPKAKGVVIQEPSETTITTTTISSKQKSHDKGKGILVEEPVKPKKKEQITLDEEVALGLQAKFDEERILAREKTKQELEAIIALIET
nr:hypothetical protein [Tanacetum cinerariifolium]